MRNFEHSVNVLVKAYVNDTLQHGNCWACAVGNLICEAKGYHYLNNAWYSQEHKTIIGTNWPAFFMTDAISKKQSPSVCHNAKIGLQEIESTGYSTEELARIEFAFETAPIGVTLDDYMFNGLMAVVDILADIHHVDLKQREGAKAMFVK